MAEGITTLIVSIAVFAAVSVIAFSLWIGITPLPSTRRAREKILDLLPPGQGPIYELGFGWSGLALALAERCPERRVIGYELSPMPFMISKLRQRMRGIKNLELHWQDFAQANLSDAEVVVCYLYPSGMQRLTEMLARDASRNTVVISNTFSIRDWKHTEVYELNDIYRTRIWVYTVDH